MTETLNIIFKTAYKTACDYPDMFHCLVTVIDTLISHFPKQFKLHDIHFEHVEDEDDNNDIIDFFT